MKRFLPRTALLLLLGASSLPLFASTAVSVVYARERLALAQELMKEKTVSLNEAKRRAQQTSIENRQLAMENALRKSKGQEPLKELKREDENALPEEDDKTKPQDDAYLTESGHILLDYLNLNSAVAKH